MTLLEIITPENPILLQEATEIAQIDAELQTLIDNMIETMRDKNGLGLAAPQVGISKRMAIIETLADYDDDDEPIENSRQLYVIINPTIVWRSRKERDGVEGCLSIPGYLGEVTRPYAIRLKFTDRHGKRHRMSLNGWDARVFLHEIDHLDGILFTDKLTAPENYWTDEAYDAKFKAENAPEADPETDPQTE